MRVLCCTEPGKMQIQQKPEPLLQPGHAIIQVKRVGVCGTDLHAYQGRQPFFSYPRIFGHELAGVITEVSANTGDFTKGDSVTVIPYYNCGTCIACINGKTNCCVQIQVLGVHIDGGLSEYISVPVQYLVKGKGLDYDALAIVEPFAIAAHAVERAAISPGEFVLVMGAGPIGIATIHLAAMAGASVIILDTNEFRLHFWSASVPHAHLIQPGKDDILEKLQAITGNNMPTVVIDATGNLQAINSGFSYLAHGGRYVLVGLQRDTIQFSHPEFHKREATLMSSRNATRKHFDFVINAIQSGNIDPNKYITHRVSFDAAAHSFDHWIDPKNNVIKAMIEVNE